jgi:hypothetical protein
VPRKKRVEIKSGDVFVIPLSNGKFAVGQVLDMGMTNTARIALFDEVIETTFEPDTKSLCETGKLISLIQVTREQLDYGVWKIITNKEVLIPLEKYPNEVFRERNWIGATIHDAAIAEDFVHAFFTLAPWDDWFDPNYLDKFLVDQSKKPKVLIFIKQ